MKKSGGCRAAELFRQGDGEKVIMIILDMEWVLVSKSEIKGNENIWYS